MKAQEIFWTDFSPNRMHTRAVPREKLRESMRSLNDADGQFSVALTAASAPAAFHPTHHGAEFFVTLAPMPDVCTDLSLSRHPHTIATSFSYYYSSRSHPTQDQIKNS